MISFANAFFLDFWNGEFVKTVDNLWKVWWKMGKNCGKKVKKDFKIKVLFKKGSILLKIIA